MYYNRRTIGLLNIVKLEATKQGLTYAQTSSRLNGSYLDAVRIYEKAEDKGRHPHRALWMLTDESELRDCLNGLTGKSYHYNNKQEEWVARA